MSKYPGSPERIRQLLGLIDGCLATVRAEANLEERIASEVGDAIAALVELKSEWEQTPLAKLAVDEPYFVVRGQDVLFPATVLDYAERLRSFEPSEETHSELVQIAVSAIRWQSQNRIKVAD